jgi:hypothetical protein
MNDLTGLGKVGVQLIQTGEKFLEKLLGPYLEERGEMLADSVRAKRRLNLAAIAGMASQHGPGRHSRARGHEIERPQDSQRF